jgi:uncharacterized membrane protein HdeD (DUF308 family)
MEYVDFIREACKGDALLSILVSIAFTSACIGFVSLLMSGFQVVQSFKNRRSRL